MTAQHILWRGDYLKGHESCRVYQLNSEWHLNGFAAFAHDNVPCRFEYDVVSNCEWTTRHARVAGWLGSKHLHFDIKVENGSWFLNNVPQPQVSDCTDLDLNFSPATNLLPIRRLNLEVGQESLVNAAWLRFPSFELEHLAQIYRRADETTYRYESGGGSFVADLTVNSTGLVTSYPGIWEMETYVSAD